MEEALEKIVSGLVQSADNQLQLLQMLKGVIQRVNELEEKVLILQAERISYGK